MQLIVENLEKTYDGRKMVLSGISFEVQKGEFVVLVGPSGCGKSTVLRCIAGLETASGGKISIAGRDVTNLAPRDRNVAMVFQDYALYPHKLVYDNIAFGLRIRKVPEDEIAKKVHAVAAKLELEKLLHRKPAALSGGQRQRVAIGRAIVRNPDLFLFDEPLSNLDAQLRVSMRLTISQLHRELGASAVYVTHDQVEAMTLADRIVVLQGGRIQQVGAPLELYYYPANEFVGQFIGTPPMNILRGLLKINGDKMEFASHQGLHFLIPPAVKSKLSPSLHDGMPVSLGIRAENLVLLKDSTPKDTPRFEAEVIHAESLGASTSVYCQLAGHRVQISIPEPDRPVCGDKLSLRWWADHIYLFSDEDGGKSLVVDHNVY